MSRFVEALETLSSRGPFKSTQLARLAGLSRQAALRELRLRVASGELRIEGTGRGTWYVRGDPRKVASIVDRFWEPLIASSAGNVSYVRISSTVSPTPTRRSEADRILASVGSASFAFLDFDGVQLASRAFLRRLLFDPFRPSTLAKLKPINCSVSIRAELDRLALLDQLTPKSDYGT